METRTKGTKTAVSVLVLAGLVVFGLTAIGGDLEPSAPPGPTMKTLDEISAEIAACSSPIKQVVRGRIIYDAGRCWASQDFSPPVDPSKSVVFLSDAICHSAPSSSNILQARTGACLTSLGPSSITVLIDGVDLPVTRSVSYQIIEYK